ncbi:uncharacterized protein LOC134247350 [Saccostrea cucullata]|uniref:uncharacterized protein LOC134247350 n=1 Tax=Saccostrea cuccullata TaxID=36930 RepID=UPI002ED0DE8B
MKKSANPNAFRYPSKGARAAYDLEEDSVREWPLLLEQVPPGTEDNLSPVSSPLFSFDSEDDSLPADSPPATWVPPPHTSRRSLEQLPNKRPTGKKSNVYINGLII